MRRMSRVIGTSGAAVALVAGVGACGADEVATTGTNTLTVEVTNLVGAEGSQLRADLTKNVDYGQEAPTWGVLTTTVTGSPFTFSDTLEGLPEGEFGLVVLAGSSGKSEAAQVKGQGCEMTLTMGTDEAVVITIDGLNEFGDKGYGECNATRR